jgi:hypothetical protein
MGALRPCADGATFLIAIQICKAAARRGKGQKRFGSWVLARWQTDSMARRAISGERVKLICQLRSNPVHSSVGTDEHVPLSLALSRWCRVARRDGTLDSDIGSAFTRSAGRSSRRRIGRKRRKYPGRLASPCTVRLVANCWRGKPKRFLPQFPRRVGAVPGVYYGRGPDAWWGPLAQAPGRYLPCLVGRC